MESIKKIENGNLNDVYKLVINNKKYILRMTEFNNDCEINTLLILKKYNLNVPNLLAHFSVYNKNVMLLDYIEGSNPLKIDTKFITELLRQLKKLHNIPYEDLEEKSINTIENFERLSKYYVVSKKSNFLKQKIHLINSILEDVKDIPFDKMPKCIVHSDIKKENVLVNNNTVYIIDFGNSYIGNRLIDLVRIIMWFFLKNNDFNIEEIENCFKVYFENNHLIDLEYNSLSKIIKFCVVYNLIKDVYLFEKGFLSENYVVKNDTKWLNLLENGQLLEKVKEALNNASRYS